MSDRGDASMLYCQGCGSNPADPCVGYPLYCTPTCKVQLYRKPLSPLQAARAFVVAQGGTLAPECIVRNRSKL